MLVRDCMTYHPIMVAPTMPLSEAQQLMADNRIRHLPVVEDGKRLVGLLTRDSLTLKPDVLGSLNVWEITRSLAGLTVRQVMIKLPQVKMITPNRSVERAAGIMLENKVGCLPVVEDEKNKVVVGIVTAVDMLHSLQEMLGLPDTGVRVTVRMQNKKAEGLGLPLPSGGVVVMQRQYGEDMLLGDGDMADKTIGEEVEIRAGSSDQVRIQQTVIANDRKKRTIRIIVTNALDARAPVEIMLPRLNGFDMGSDAKLKKKDGQWLWETTVPANGQRVMKVNYSRQ